MRTFHQAAIALRLAGFVGITPSTYCGVSLR